jgi:hypothetical protein
MSINNCTASWTTHAALSIPHIHQMPCDAAKAFFQCYSRASFDVSFKVHFTFFNSSISSYRELSHDQVQCLMECYSYSNNPQELNQCIKRCHAAKNLFMSSMSSFFSTKIIKH